MTMNWRFCPHCETQLDEATGICPACRWDPLEEPAPAAPQPELSLMERYRGTEYDSHLTMAPAMLAERRRQGPTTKVKVLMLGGVLALVGLYGGILAYSQYRADDRPVVPASIGTAR